MAKDCPSCGLINPPHAQRCDCGYEFATGQQRGTLLNEHDQAVNQENAEAMRTPIPVTGGCAGVLVAGLIIYGSNGWGLVLAALAFLPAFIVATAFKLGAAGGFLCFGLSLVALDLGHRGFVIRVPLMNHRAGSRFALLPVWMWGIVALVIGTAIALGQNA